MSDVEDRASAFYDKVHNETYGIGGNKVFERLVEATNHIQALLRLNATPEATFTSEDSAVTSSESSRPQGLQPNEAVSKEYKRGYNRGFGVGSGDEGAYQREIRRLKDELSRVASHNREPPHCSSCHCETPSMLDQIRQNDADTPAVFLDKSESLTAQACKDRRWLLRELDRLRAELSQWEQQTKGQIWLANDEYGRLTSRDKRLQEIEDILEEEEDPFGT